MDKSFNFFIIVVCIFILIMICAMLTTENRYCNGNNAINKTKLFGLTIKTSYLESDTYCEYK